MSSPKAVRNPIWDSPEVLEGQLSVFGTRFSVPFGAQESSTASDRAKFGAKIVFLGVGGSGRRPSRMSADPARRVGQWRKRVP